MPAGGGGAVGGGATSSSNFAAAARVLFQSAQKIGAVKPLNKTGREYAQQLAEIQKHSRKRGGSLGSVSYNVAEFLSAQRLRPHTQVPKSQTSFPLSQAPNAKQILQKSKLSSMSIAKSVPLLDFVDKVYRDNSNKNISDKTFTQILTEHPHENRLADRENNLVTDLHVGDSRQKLIDKLELQSDKIQKRWWQQKEEEQQQKNLKMELTPSSSSAKDNNKLAKTKEESETLRKRQMEPQSAISRKILTDMIRKRNINSFFDSKMSVLDSTFTHHQESKSSKTGEKAFTELSDKSRESENDEENKQEHWQQELRSSLEQKKCKQEETLHEEENATLEQHLQKENVIDKTRTANVSDSVDNSRASALTQISHVAIVEDEPMFTVRKDVDVDDVAENLTSSVKSNLPDSANITETLSSSSSSSSSHENTKPIKLTEPPPLVKSVTGVFGKKERESDAMMSSAPSSDLPHVNSSNIVLESMLKTRKVRPKVSVPIAINTRTSSKENEEQNVKHKLTLEISTESQMKNLSSSDMLNLGLDAAAAQTSSGNVADAAILSVDTWERQREQEIERLRQKQQDEEEERLAELRAEQQRMEGVEWVRKRSQETTSSCLKDSEELALMRGVQFKSEVQESVKDFAKLTELGTRVPAPFLTVAAATTAYRIKRSEPNKHEQLTSSFVNILEKANLPTPVAKRVKLKVTDDDEEFLQTFCKLSNDEMYCLDRNTVVRAIFALTHLGRWQEAINVAKESRTYLQGSVSVVPLALARAAMRLKEEDRAQVAAYVRSTLEEDNKMNYEAKLALANLEGSIRRRHALIQLTASSDADERVFASLIYNSDRDQISKILEDVEQRGLNSHDPIILRAVANRSIDAQNPMEVYKEVKKQMNNIGARPMHVEVIANALRIHPTSEFVNAAMELLKLIPSCYVNSVCKKVFTVMHTTSLHSEIVELYEYFDEEVGFVKSFPKYTPFINEALKTLGRPPISALTLKDIGFDATALINSSQKEGKTNQKMMSAYEISEITERMLTYAKEKNWQEAHKVVKELGLVSADNAAAITLLYNCALGAAVGEPNVMKSVYSLMLERNVRVNVTTVNTILSGYGKANMCDDALHFYNETNNSNKDTNTYLMALTILGKNRKWEQAMSIYEDACKKLKKPPLTVYTIAIAATAADDWQSTFRIFEEMIKAHGNNVKENITKQVIRCLERNKRSVELMKVAELLKKKRKIK